MIAGGKSSRFGSDKALALLNGRPLIDHAIGVLEPRVGGLVMCGREWGDLPALVDPAPDLGPLGGIAAALAYAEANGFESVLTIACDMPEVPADLLDALVAATPSYCSDAPILGHWPASLAEALYAHLGQVLPRRGRGTALEERGGGGPPQALRSRRSPSTSFAGPPPPAGEELNGGKQRHLSIRRWAEAIGATAIPGPNLRNINTPADLT